MCTAIVVFERSQCNIDIKSINVLLAAILLASVNWRSVFANDRHIDDFVCSCMHILSDVITQSAPATSTRINKAKSILPYHIRRLIIRKRRLWNKIKDQASHAAYKAACEEVKSVLGTYVFHCEEELLNCRNQAEFYKCLNKSIGKSIMSIQLTNSLGDIINTGLDTANAFNQEFVSNCFPAEVLHRLAAIHLKISLMSLFMIHTWLCLLRQTL